jgi:hypothetical protein
MAPVIAIKLAAAQNGRQGDKRVTGISQADPR